MRIIRCHPKAGKEGEKSKNEDACAIHHSSSIHLSI